MRRKSTKLLRLFAVALALSLTGVTAQAVTIDGVISAGEWTGAPVLILDPNEASVPDSYDVQRIMMTGGPQLYVAVEVWNNAPLFTSAPVPTGRAFLNFDWNEVDGPSRYYGLTLNDHKGFSPGQLHLVEYADATRTAFADLGLASFSIGSAIEMTVPWSMLSGVDPDHDGYVTFNSFGFLYNNGGQPPDDDHSNSTVERNDPVPVIPEPLTLTGLALAAGATLPRLLRRCRRSV